VAKPQTEDGYLRIADELVEALAKTNFSAHESRVMWCIFRKTYGWKKKLDWIAGSQFRKMTGLDRRHVFRALEKLEKRQIIVIQTDDKNPRSYGIQKNYDHWVLSSKEMTRVKLSSKQMTDVSSKEAHTKDTITKDIRHSPKISHLPNRKNTKSQPAVGFKETMGLYYELFVKRFGAKPDIDGGRDGNILSGLIAAHGAAEVQALLRFFFDYPPAWVEKSGKFTLPAFKSAYTEILAQSRNGHGQHQEFVG
jgi:phage replication O-like protein O